MTFSKRSRIFAFFLAVFYASNTAVYADTFIGKIESIRTLEGGQREVVLSKGEKRETLRLDSKTAVESVVTADQLKAGATIYIAPKPASSGGGRGGGYKGIKSPFKGIPKNLQKSMGLPSMPETPDVPGQPVKTMDLPQIPKVPKVPKAPKEKNAEEPAAEAPEEGKKQMRKPVQPPVQEPSEEEKTLYGKVSSDKPLLKSTGEPLKPQVRNVAKKVLSVKTVKEGIKVELEGEGGNKESVIFLPNRGVLQAFPSTGLRKDMQVKAEIVKTDKLNRAQKITVFT